MKRKKPRKHPHRVRTNRNIIVLVSIERFGKISKTYHDKRQVRDKNRVQVIKTHINEGE